MELEDYETPDPYAPRPKASQSVAAQKRAAIHADDAPLPAPRMLQSQQQLIMGGIGVLAIIGVLFLAISQAGHAPTALPITPLPTERAAAVGAPTTPPAPAPTDPPSAPTISAYAAPDGALLGQIAADRVITPVAHYGSAWLAYQDGAGLVWVRASDRPDLALIGPDLAPVAAAPMTGRGLTLESGGDPPPPPPAATPEIATPPAPTATVVWPTSAPSKAPDFQQPSVIDRCKFITCLGQLAVDSAHAQACHALYWQYGDSESIPEPDLSAVRQCTWEGLYK